MHRRLGWLVAVLLLAAGCGDPAEDSVQRGDRLLGAGEVDAAIAEYKLALRQGGESPEALLRLGHAYAVRGDVDEALRYYEPLLARDSSYRHQMAGDLIGVAREAASRGARESMSRALTPLVNQSLGLIPSDLRLSLARYHWADGDHARALPLYLSVLAEEEEVTPSVHYETARAYAALGGCLESLEHFQHYLAGIDPTAPELPSARWHYGNCLFQVAEVDHAGGRPRASLEKLDRMVQLGVPQTLMDRAHFLRGELLLAMGQEERALRAYQEVLRLNPARTGPLAQRADARIRQIRFGR